MVIKYNQYLDFYVYIQADLTLNWTSVELVIGPGFSKPFQITGDIFSNKINKVQFPLITWNIETLYEIGPLKSGACHVLSLKVALPLV